MEQVRSCGNKDGSLVLREVYISWYVGLRRGEMTYVEYYGKRG